MTATVQADLRPTRCTCRCGCDYGLQSEMSRSEARCFSCRVGLHAGHPRATTRIPIEGAGHWRRALRTA